MTTSDYLSYLSDVVVQTSLNIKCFSDRRVKQSHHRHSFAKPSCFASDMHGQGKNNARFSAALQLAHSPQSKCIRELRVSLRIESAQHTSAYWRTCSCLKCQVTVSNKKMLSYDRRQQNLSTMPAVVEVEENNTTRVHVRRMTRPLSAELFYSFSRCVELPCLHLLACCCLLGFACSLLLAWLWLLGFAYLFLLACLLLLDCFCVLGFACLFVHACYRFLAFAFCCFLLLDCSLLLT